MVVHSSRSLVDFEPRAPPRKSCLKDLSQSDSLITTMRRSTTTASLSDDDSCLHKRVYFDEICIREYPQILGDNPAVSEGVPLALDWEYQNQYTINIEMYEYTRAPVRRKSRKKLMTSPKKRLRTLIEAGYTLDEIGDAAMEVQKAKDGRLKSVRAFGWNGPRDFLSGAVETTASGIRAVKKRSSKIFMGGLIGGIQKIKLAQPRRKSYSNPAC